MTILTGFGLGSQLLGNKGILGSNGNATSVGPFICDWTKDTAFDIDLTGQQWIGLIDHVETVFVDNSGASPDEIFLTLPTGQIIEVPGSTQGYYSVLAGTPFKMLVTSPNAAQKTRIHLLNYAVPNQNWPATVATS